MRKLAAVEHARAIMTEGMEWGVWKWLLEKKRVRAIADEARAALDEAEKKVKAAWSDDWKIAYNHLVSQDNNARRVRKNGPPAAMPATHKVAPEIAAAIKHVKEADDEAYNAHEDAEDAFAEAEKRMSTRGARDAAHMALVAYDLHEEAIRKAEALARTK